MDSRESFFDDLFYHLQCYHYLGERFCRSPEEMTLHVKEVFDKEMENIYYKKLSFEKRITQVVIIYDRLIHEGKSQREVLDQIKEGAAVKYDPLVVIGLLAQLGYHIVQCLQNNDCIDYSDFNEITVIIDDN